MNSNFQFVLMSQHDDIQWKHQTSLFFKFYSIQCFNKFQLSYSAVVYAIGNVAGFSSVKLSWSRATQGRTFWKEYLIETDWNEWKLHWKERKWLININLYMKIISSSLNFQADIVRYSYQIVSATHLICLNSNFN